MSQSTDTPTDTPNIDYLTVTKLKLQYTNLYELPDLSKYINLQELDCSNNKLKTLDNLPPNLKQLICYYNNVYYYFLYLY